MDPKPIPAFYCCYLLRSTQRTQSLYIGSTPNPLRRLNQHNGETLGGASRTGKKHLQPWEMACMVTGFPSRLAALQFEWAWQNSHKTKRIPDDDRISESRSQVRKTKSGTERKKMVRHSHSLEVRLLDMHQLLRVPSFVRWPLSVRFFRDDVFHKWQAAGDRVPGQLRKDLDVALDTGSDPGEFEDGIPPSGQPSLAASLQAEHMVRLRNLEVTYANLRDTVLKAQSLVVDSESKCTVCASRLQDDQQAVLVCPQADCRAATHMSCLGRRFLERDSAPAAVVPISGRCPGCQRKTLWADLTRELSLRTRGERELALLMKARRRRKGADVANHSLGRPMEAQPAIESEDVEMPEADDEPLAEDWQPIDTDDETATVSSVASDPSDGDETPRGRPLEPRLEVVIEDSDWEDAERLD